MKLLVLFALVAAAMGQQPQCAGLCGVDTPFVELNTGEECFCEAECLFWNDCCGGKAAYKQACQSGAPATTTRPATTTTPTTTLPAPITTQPPPVVLPPMFDLDTPEGQLCQGLADATMKFCPHEPFPLPPLNGRRMLGEMSALGLPPPSKELYAQTQYPNDCPPRPVCKEFPAAGTCQDQDEDCASFAAMGYCQRGKAGVGNRPAAFYNARCPRACGLCQLGGPKTTPAPRVRCGAGSSSPDGFAPCQPCIRGTFTSTVGSVECQNASPGYEVINNGAAQKACNDIASFCAGGVKTEVAVGSYSTPEVGVRQGQKRCEPGYFCVRGARTVCPAGSFCPAGASKATLCLRGTTSEEGSAVCEAEVVEVPCETGQWSATGKSPCRSCPAGTFTNIAGANECLTPRAGFYANEDGTNQVACVTPANYCEGGLMIAVSRGYVSVDATAQAICPAGSYCVGGVATTCPRGKVCPRGSAAPQDCPEDMVAPRAGMSTCERVTTTTAPVVETTLSPEEEEARRAEILAAAEAKAQEEAVISRGQNSLANSLAAQEKKRCCDLRLPCCAP